MLATKMLLPFSDVNHTNIVMCSRALSSVVQFAVGRHSDYAENSGVQVEFMGLLAMIVDREPCKPDVSDTRIYPPCEAQSTEDIIEERRRERVGGSGPYIPRKLSIFTKPRW